MKINQLKAGVVLSYSTQAVHILSGLLYTPVMLRLLGQSEYGLYQLVYSFVSYLSLLSLGFGVSYIRFYSRCKMQDDEREIARLNGMFMLIFTVIAVVCLLCGGFMIVNARTIFGEELTIAELAKTKILLVIMVFNMAATFVDSVFTSIITAHEKFFFQRLVKFLRELFNPFLTLPLLILGYGSVAMVAVTTVLTVSGLVVDAFFCLKKLKTKFCFSSMRFSLFKEMWGFTFFIFINMVVDQINWNVDKVLLGRMIGTGAVAVYGVAAQLNSLYIALSTAVSGVFVPRVNRMVAENNDNNGLTLLMIKVGRIQFLILGLIISGYVVFGRVFIPFWAGAGYDKAYVMGLFLMIPATAPLIQNLGLEIQRAKNKHKTRSVVYLFVALSNIFVSIPCIKQWGAGGAAVGTAVSLTFGNILFMNYYYHKKMNLDMGLFWKKIFGLLIPTVVAGIIGKVIAGFWQINGRIWVLIVQMVIYVGMYAVIQWRFGMNESERNLIIVPLKKNGGRLWKK